MIGPETNVYAAPRPATGRVAALLRDPRYAAYVAAAALMFSGQFAFITGSSFALITILGVSPTVYGACFAAVAAGLMAGNFVSVRLGPRLGIDTMIRGGTLISAVAGVVMAALAWAGVASVAAVIAHQPEVFAAYMGFERAFGRASKVEAKLTTLAAVKVASLVGCPF